MKKILCFTYMGLLFAGFLRFLKIETGTATHGRVNENLHYSEARAAMLKAM